jgi:competence protein ComEA
MDWIKLKLAEVVGSNQPVSKKLLVLMVSLVAAGIFLINTITDPKEAAVSVSVESEDAEVVIKPAEIFVHVVGEVISPGIYQLKSGARLMDAVFAAGGLSKSADQSSVNLARELSDGEQVMVFRIGESPVLSGGKWPSNKKDLELTRAGRLSDSTNRFTGFSGN